MSTPGSFEELSIPEIPDACRGCEIVQLCFMGLQHLRGEMEEPQRLWQRMRHATPAERQQLQEELAHPAVTPAEALWDHNTAVMAMTIGLQDCPNGRAQALRPSTGPCSNEPIRQMQMLAPLSDVLAPLDIYQTTTARLAEELSQEPN